MDGSSTNAALHAPTRAHVDGQDDGSTGVEGSEARAVAELLRAISDAIVGRQHISPRIGHAYNAVLASRRQPPV